MCRWFAYISPTEPCLLEDVLVSPKHSLVKQVADHYIPHLLPHEHDKSSEDDAKARNFVFNFDGLGVAWYTSSNTAFELPEAGESEIGAQQDVPALDDQPYVWVADMDKKLRPALYKTTQPPRYDTNFLSICANTETRALFGHIRASSGTATVTTNNHPFVFGRHAFMHNGAASDFGLIKRAVINEMSDAAYANVYGGTDSEHIAGLYMTYLTKGGDASSFEKIYPEQDMAVAMHKAVATVISLQQKLIGPSKRANSLNLCATDGMRLMAYRFRNHKTSQPPTLYYSTKAGVTLNRKYPDNAEGAPRANRDAGIPAERHGDHLIVASEPSTYKESDWKLIGRNQFLVAGPDGSFEVEDCPYGAEWDGQD